MTQNPQDPQLQPDPTSSGGVKGKHRYNGLVVGGALTALVFLLFTLVSGVSLDGTINPLWIGVILGVMVTGLGIFRVLLMALREIPQFCSPVFLSPCELS